MDKELFTKKMGELQERIGVLSFRILQDTKLRDEAISELKVLEQLTAAQAELEKTQREAEAEKAKADPESLPEDLQ